MASAKDLRFSISSVSSLLPALRVSICSGVAVSAFSTSSAIFCHSARLVLIASSAAM